MRKYKGLKVLYVGSPPLFSKGASSINMLKMCQAMTNLDIDVELLLPGHFSKSKLFKYYGIKSKFKVKSIPFTDILLRQIIHGISSAFYLLFSKKDYQFIMTRNLIFCYLSCLLLKLPTVYDAHHPPVNKIARSIIKSFVKSKYFIGMTFNSKGLKDIYIKDGIEFFNSVVAHNGVDLTDYQNLNSSLELRAELNLPINKKIVCYCGNTYKGRGIEYLIEAAAVLNDLEFIIVGGLESDNSYYRKVVKEKAISNFNILGFVDHNKVPMYLKASDVLIMPYSSNVTIKGGTTASEFTSPIKLFEYLASGKPIIATKLSAITEILHHNSNSYLIKPDDIDDIIDALNTVLSDDKLYNQLSENSLKSVEGYSWEKRVEKIIEKLELFDKLN